MGRVVGWKEARPFFSPYIRGLNPSSCLRSDYTVLKVEPKVFIWVFFSMLLVYFTGSDLRISGQSPSRVPVSLSLHSPQPSGKMITESQIPSGWKSPLRARVQLFPQRGQGITDPCLTSSHLLKPCRDDGSTTSLSSLCQRLKTCLVRKYFLISNLNLPKSWGHFLFSYHFVLCTRVRSTPHLPTPAGSFGEW